MKDALNWFELHTLDLPRATRFYEAVFGWKLKVEDFQGAPLVVFPSDEAGVGGALVQDPERRPSTEGTRVYLNAQPSLDACLARVEGAGGKVLVPKTGLGPMGFLAVVLDTEGNRVGLHVAAQ